MPTVPVPRERAVYLDDGVALRVILPPRRSAFMIVFLALWLAMWFAAASSVRHELSAPGPTPGRAFVAVWLALWILGGVFMAFIFLWMLFGRELIELRPDQLVLSKSLFGLPRSRAYDLTHVRGLRVGPVVPPLFDGLTFQRIFDKKARRRYDFTDATAAWGLGGGPIVFDYGPQTIRCGACLDEAEGKIVVERLRRRNSRLRSDGAA